MPEGLSREKEAMLKHKNIVSEKLRRSANGEICKVMIPGICSHNPETVVLAHIDDAPVTEKGLGIKGHDILAAHCCYQCHEWLGGGYANHGVSRETRDLYHYRAMARTLVWWAHNGFIKIS
jgi:phage terminase large subunit